MVIASLSRAPAWPVSPRLASHGPVPRIALSRLQSDMAWLSDLAGRSPPPSRPTCTRTHPFLFVVHVIDSQSVSSHLHPPLPNQVALITNVASF